MGCVVEINNTPLSVVKSNNDTVVEINTYNINKRYNIKKISKE